MKTIKIHSCESEDDYFDLCSTCAFRGSGTCDFCDEGDQYERSEEEDSAVSSTQQLHFA